MWEEQTLIEEDITLDELCDRADNIAQYELTDVGEVYKAQFEELGAPSWLCVRAAYDLQQGVTNSPFAEFIREGYMNHGEKYTYTVLDEDANVVVSWLSSDRLSDEQVLTVFRTYDECGGLTESSDQGITVDIQLTNIQWDDDIQHIVSAEIERVQADLLTGTFEEVMAQIQDGYV